MPGSTGPGPLAPQGPLTSYASVAHVARVYDYLLGGKDYFAVDAQAAEQARQINPDIVSTARANRAFLARATRYLACEAGIRQFLDIGTGIPARNSVHEVAQSIGPESRVVCVDHDPIVLSHARALLTPAPDGRTDYLEADLREPDAILAQAARTLDFGRPVAVMLISVLHLVLDEENPYQLVRRLTEAVVPGSYVAISHAASDTDSGEMIFMADRLNELMAEKTVPRSHRQVARFFEGFDLLEPGLVGIQQWRPAPDADTSAPAQMWGGIGRKP